MCLVIEDHSCKMSLQNTKYQKGMDV